MERLPNAAWQPAPPVGITADGCLRRHLEPLFERSNLTVESRWTEEDVLSNYGYDPDALLREVYGPILDAGHTSVAK